MNIRVDFLLVKWALGGRTWCSSPWRTSKNRTHVLSHPRSGWENDLCNVIFIPNPTNALWSAVVQPSSSSGSEPTEQVKIVEATDLGRTWDTQRRGRYLSIPAGTDTYHLWKISSLPWERGKAEMTQTQCFLQEGPARRKGLIWKT